MSARKVDRPLRRAMLINVRLRRQIFSSEVRAGPRDFFEAPVRNDLRTRRDRAPVTEPDEVIVENEHLARWLSLHRNRAPSCTPSRES